MKVTKIGSVGKRLLSGKRPDKIWLNEKTEENTDGERLQVVNVYLSQAEGSRMIFIDK